MFCHKCGAQQAESSGFCSICGIKLSSDNATPIETPVHQAAVTQEHQQIPSAYQAPQPVQQHANAPVAYAPHYPVHLQKKSKKPIIFTVMGILSVIIVAAVLYFFVFRENDDDLKPNNRAETIETTADKENDGSDGDITPSPQNSAGEGLIGVWCRAEDNMIFEYAFRDDMYYYFVYDTEDALVKYVEEGSYTFDSEEITISTNAYFYHNGSILIKVNEGQSYQENYTITGDNLIFGNYNTTLIRGQSSGMWGFEESEKPLYITIVYSAWEDMMGYSDPDNLPGCDWPGWEGRYYDDGSGRLVNAGAVSIEYFGNYDCLFLNNRVNEYDAIDVTLGGLEDGQYTIMVDFFTDWGDLTFFIESVDDINYPCPVLAESTGTYVTLYADFTVNGGTHNGSNRLRLNASPLGEYYIDDIVIYQKSDNTIRNVNFHPFGEYRRVITLGDFQFTSNEFTQCGWMTDGTDYASSHIFMFDFISSPYLVLNFAQPPAAQIDIALIGDYDNWNWHQTDSVLPENYRSQNEFVIDLSLLNGYSMFTRSNYAKLFLNYYDNNWNDLELIDVYLAVKRQA